MRMIIISLFTLLRPSKQHPFVAIRSPYTLLVVLSSSYLLLQIRIQSINNNNYCHAFTVLSVPTCRQFGPSTSPSTREKQWNQNIDKDVRSRQSFRKLATIHPITKAFIDRSCDHIPPLTSKSGSRVLCSTSSSDEDSTTTSNVQSTNQKQQSRYYQVSIEYCTGCRWGLRAFWMAQEILMTFADNVTFQAVTIRPSRPPALGGRYIIQLFPANADGSSSEGPHDDAILIWDRSNENGFPELKVLKQRIRKYIAPNLFLGHSDTPDKQHEESTNNLIDDENEVTEWTRNEPAKLLSVVQDSVSPNIALLYCTGCRWLLRSAYYAQELMVTFADEINSITLIPSRPPTVGGSFMVGIDQEVIWDRSITGTFPETKELKQRIRNIINPTKNLGHSDTSNTKPMTDDTTATSTTTESIIDEFDDDQAEEARKFFGVFKKKVKFENVFGGHGKTILLSEKSTIHENQVQRI